MVRALTPARVLSRFQHYFQTESASGSVLLACTVLALAWANSPWRVGYFDFWHMPLGLTVGGWQLELELHHWINDGLMALFFFLVGLEIKRELLVGELSNVRRAMLPLFGALGGMLVPALLYLALNQGTAAARGWGVPVATDIAFALAVVALLGSRVPLGLKVFLTALAIIDDMGAVAVIALFYAGELNLPMLWLGAGAIVLCACFNLAGVRRLTPYLVVGLVAWYGVLQSGVHATIAGVLLALCIPARATLNTQEFVNTARDLLERFARLKPPKRKAHQRADHLSSGQTELLSALEESAEQVMTPLERLERALHQPVAFGIMPLFALANAGLDLGTTKIGRELMSPVSLGIILGLVLGKQLGVTLFAWLAVKLRVAALPQGVNWAQLYATAWVCGIGFTMSLFIANLAFGGSSEALDTAKLGILCASLLAGVGGYLLLRWQLTPAA